VNTIGFGDIVRLEWDRPPTNDGRGLDSMKPGLFRWLPVPFGDGVVFQGVGEGTRRLTEDC
jgi:hypothetical protein